MVSHDKVSSLGYASGPDHFQIIRNPAKLTAPEYPYRDPSLRFLSHLFGKRAKQPFAAKKQSMWFAIIEPAVVENPKTSIEEVA